MRLPNGGVLRRPQLDHTAASVAGFTGALTTRPKKVLKDHSFLYDLIWIFPLFRAQLSCTILRLGSLSCAVVSLLDVA